MVHPELIPHLFRTEFSKITAVLCKQFGIDHIGLAEDIAGETFLAALETWPYKGIPANPAAWLYAVAQNKTKNYLKRDLSFTQKIAPQVKNIQAQTEEPVVDLSDTNISDSQLQMLFAVCHPSIPAEAQVALSLRVLCGFGIDEIANAFLTHKETINKRLYRAKEKLKTEKVRMEIPSSTAIHKRLETVLTTLYLLFNEGYYSESHDEVVRKDLCLEAMRLMRLLIDNESTNQPAVNALFALMCFHASRLEARKTASGELILYNDQDETLWNRELIAEGAFYFKESARGNQLTKYHLEAGIAYWHTIKTDSTEKWEAILQLYNRLLQIEYSPVAALNRTFALSKANGKNAAIAEAEKLELKDNHYYYTLLGELYRDTDNTKARAYFSRAIALAKTQADKDTISKKLQSVD